MSFDSACEHVARRFFCLFKKSAAEGMIANGGECPSSSNYFLIMKITKIRVSSILGALCFMGFMNLAAIGQTREDLPVHFDSPVEADSAFDRTPDFEQRLGLIRPMAEAYLCAGELNGLVKKLRAVDSASPDAWHGTFSLANLYFDLGDFAEAKSRLAAIPQDHQNEPVVLQFTTAHPELAGGGIPDVTLLKPGELSPESRFFEVKADLDAIEPAKAISIINTYPDDLLNAPLKWNALTPQIYDENLAPQIIPLLKGRIKRDPNNWAVRIMLAEYLLFEGSDDEALPQLEYLREHLPQSEPHENDVAVRITPFDDTSLETLARGQTSLRELETAQNARDLAFIYLADLALKNGGGQSFLDKTEASISGAGEPERMLTYMLLHTPGRLLHEFQNYLAKNVLQLAPDPSPK